MYLNTRKHFLSDSICISAIIGLLAQFVNAIIRFVFATKLSKPDMLNAYVFNINFVTQITVILFIIFVFFFNLKRMKKTIKIVDEDDSDEIAILQRQYIPEKISSLKAKTIYQLLEIWAIILIFTHIISMVSNYQYKSFVKDLYGIIPMDTYENALVFSSIYNSTHGFKYIGMFSAIIIGIFVTAVFLEDRLLKIISVIITIFFILAFTIFHMISFDMHIKIISIVWTSVIYHGLETIGLILFSFYLTRNYKGL